MAMKGTNVVNVIAIDEERLKFRVSIAINAPGVLPRDGTYQVELSVMVLLPMRVVPLLTQHG